MAQGPARVDQLPGTNQNRCWSTEESTFTAKRHPSFFLFNSDYKHDGTMHTGTRQSGSWPNTTWAPEPHLLTRDPSAGAAPLATGASGSGIEADQARLAQHRKQARGPRPGASGNRFTRRLGLTRRPVAGASSALQVRGLRQRQSKERDHFDLSRPAVLLQATTKDHVADRPVSAIAAASCARQTAVRFQVAAGRRLSADQIFLPGPGAGIKPGGRGGRSITSASASVEAY